ncbi:MAG TPA: flagellar filament outer layer protein FlaA [Turneriella sp.]|nr:flagellar filament outer layer protein FlaA [Turneriella sp.]
MHFALILLIAGAALTNLSAADPVKKYNPNKVADFAEIDSKIYRAEMLENFEEGDLAEILEPVQPGAETVVSSDFAPPVLESRRYVSVRLTESDTRRVRLQFKKAPEVRDHCRAFTFWLNVEKPYARLTLIVEDRQGVRHFIDSGDLQFRGWRRMVLPVPQKIRQQDYYLNEKSALKLLGIEIVFSRKYAKGKLPVILIDEIAAEVRKKYEVPPELKQ